MKSIAIINGPNLNLVGFREPEVYGHDSLDHYLTTLSTKFPEVSISLFQSNIEGELIDFLHSCMGQKEGIILNAGGYTHTSIALADAIAAIAIPTIEVHISNVLAREEYRKTSFISSKCIGSISGLGLWGYELAIEYFLKKNKKSF
ncbi:MAG: type II 3-dehydroquinate dehydratase [Bacteroidetes bacterium]|nr:type II 3-dehydroquinate dehydratase [Bacteroidota bacterium]MBS1740774.1 type II 3-dehydroquinate dehydratase [Bacteroidota bacterium]